ncbi:MULTISPECIES: carbohydrate ABC transporter permease [Kribbella]|uniref:Carbohydrate ABC transporter permease n=1 Tax=Kribbella karoonensis TaxID=324851 RepID=A0ABN2D3A2_9ACTN
MRNGTASRVGTHALLLLSGVLAVLPFVSIGLISLYPPDQAPTGLALPHTINFGNYARAWNVANFSTLLRSSGIVALVVVPLAGLICILTGYAFGTMRFRCMKPLFVLFLVGLLMPFEATIIPLYYDLRAIGLSNTYPGLILPEAALFVSFGTFWMRAQFLSTSRALVEAARLDGANSWTTLWRILVPGAMPAITTMTVLFFIWSWNEFLLALVLASDPSVQTAPAGLAFFFGEHVTDVPGLAAAAFIVTTPALIVYVLLQRSFIQGVTSGGVKG